MEKRNKSSRLALILGVLLIVSFTLNVINFRSNKVIENMISYNSHDNTNEYKRDLITNSIEKTLNDMIKDGLENVKTVSIKISMNDKISLATVMITEHEEQMVSEEDIEGITIILVKSIANLEDENIVIYNQNGRKLK